MTALVLLDCDARDCTEQADTGSITVAEARRRAREDGWVRQHGHDVCPHCARTGARVPA